MGPHPFRRAIALLAGVGILPAGCGDNKNARGLPEADGPPGSTSEVEVSSIRVVEKMEGIATWYEVPEDSLAARRGSDDDGLTAAHRILPLGTKVRVTNWNNGRQVTVEITDRGIGRSPTIDVSKVAAQKLGMLEEGKVPVTLEVLEDVD